MITRDKQKQYIAEEIGTDYQEWKPTDIILITAPTGSGKTYFVLNTLLLKRAIARGERILYLVNRKILKMQLETEIRKIDEDYQWNIQNNGIRVRGFIDVETYQNIERKLRYSNIDQMYNEYNKYFAKYSIVVYDECHYFYCDSNFNTFTELSYSFLRFCFDARIQIFMSATIDSIEEQIKMENPLYIYREDVPKCISGEAQLILQDFTKRLRKYRSYSAKIDYSHVNVNSFQNLDDLCMIIKTNLSLKKERWLIFVDSKIAGRKLKTELENGNNENDNINWKEEVVYVDADYRKDDEANSSVGQLARDNLIDKKVIITTAVMDNGISFHDLKLRNIVILTDTREEFLQMLGRKREDGKRINLYICNRKRDYFANRYLKATKKYEVYDKITSYIDGIYFISAANRIMPPLIFHYYLMKYNIKVSLYAQQCILSTMIQEDSVYNAMKEFTYSYQGIMANNRFSVQRLHNLKEFYQEMNDAMENDDMAFIRKQIEWLGFKGEDVNQIVNKVEVENDERCKGRIIEVLKLYDGKNISREENMEMKKMIKDDLKVLLKRKEGVKDCYDDINKNLRPISTNIFNRSMDALDIAYFMEKVGKSNFMIKTKEAEELL